MFTLKTKTKSSIQSSVQVYQSKSDDIHKIYLRLNIVLSAG